jgi:hypothetical protein
MTETTLGLSDKTWAILELSSAGLLAALTIRETRQDIRQRGGLLKFVKPRKDFWKSSQIYSGLLITLLLTKGAIDAAKEYDFISGIGATDGSHMQLNGYGKQNYF